MKYCRSSYINYVLQKTIRNSRSDWFRTGKRTTDINSNHFNRIYFNLYRQLKDSYTLKAISVVIFLEFVCGLNFIFLTYF